MTSVEQWPEGAFTANLKDMFDTITRLELWEWFKEDPPDEDGYMWWDHENITKILQGLTDNNHSGASMAYAMRNMQYIAKNGFEEWKKKYEKKV
jgi:hypothetical protein